MLYKDPDDQNFAEEIESKMRLHFILTSCHKKIKTWSSYKWQVKTNIEKNNTFYRTVFDHLKCKTFHIDV